MSIISLRFLLFITIVILAYFALPMKARAYWLLAASVYFYGCFDPVCLAFLGTTAVSAFLSVKLIGFLDMRARGGLKKCCAFICVGLNVGLLVWVKFFDYVLSLFGVENVATIPVVLGISFYTLQAVGYCLDVYRGKYPAERNFFKFLLYMTYFPIIMQGPISRYDQLADQLFTPHRFSFTRLKDGLLLALWGFFKKVVIADRAAILVNQVFGNYADYEGLEIAIAVFLYTVQIYTDFSGFVDISRGFSQVLGIELAGNFNAPYFADSIQDFWRRWHMSLSAWFRDYIYIPLGGSRKGRGRKYVNLLVVFLVSGLWHGAGGHYVIWGLMQAVFQILGDLTGGLRKRLYEITETRQDTFSFRLGKRLVTFTLVNVSWLFFRADGLQAALSMLRSMVWNWNPWVLFDGTILELGLDGKDWNVLVVSILVLLAVSVMQQRFSVREKLNAQAFWFRYGVYIAAVTAVVVFGIYGPGYDGAQFLYMQF